MRPMKQQTLLKALVLSVGTLVFVNILALTVIPAAVQAQQGGAAASTQKPPAPPRERPPLFFREEWKQQTAPENPDLPVSQAYVRNPDLELKLYGPSGKEMVITGRDNDPQNPTHVWTGLCVNTCAM